MIDNYLDFLDRCEAFEEREYACWADVDAEFEEPIEE